jgi:hypothetical protein
VAKDNQSGFACRRADELFNIPYGKEVFTAGFGGYFLIKITNMFKTRIRYWTACTTCS